MPQNAFVFVYSGQFIERKNQRFLVEVFNEEFNGENVYLMLLGDGPDYQPLKQEFGVKNIIFCGDVSDVGYYLKACDAYVSTSKSEGMPNGVLEAMATGLPVVLSDIVQHKEIFSVNDGCGFLYEQENKPDLRKKMRKITQTADIKKLADAAFNTAHDNFNALKMSKQYQEIYLKLAKKSKF